MLILFTVGRHIRAIFQDDNVKINQAQTVNSLKVFGMCWRRLKRVLDSSIDNTRSWPKMYGNNIIFHQFVASTFFGRAVYYQIHW